MIYSNFDFQNKHMRTIQQIDFNGKRALIRVDFNVPLNSNMEVTDNSRIKAAIPTIKTVLENGGAVVLMSHLGRPKNGPEERFSLKNVISNLEDLIGKKVEFADDCIGDNATKASKKIKPGEVLLLENLRFYSEEKKGDMAFAKKLAQHGDIYINDAFGTAHRAHASTTIVAQFFEKEHTFFGNLLANEITNINKVLNANERPVTAILGGAKVSGKILILENILDQVDNILIGGGMAFTFIKAMGGKVGDSLVEEDRLQTALDILEKAKEKGVSIHLPTDTIVADAFSNDANTKEENIRDISSGFMGLDIGKETIKNYAQVIASSKIILWNGPMGVFEMPSFEKGTKEVAKALVEATKNNSFTLVGGGDSVAAINQFGWADKVSYVSTGGGAMLEYLEGKKLPAIEAIL